MKVSIEFGVLTRVPYTHEIEMPDDATEDDIFDRADEIYGDLDGGEFIDDPDYWERGATLIHYHEKGDQDG